MKNLGILKKNLWKIEGFWKKNTNFIILQIFLLLKLSPFILSIWLHSKYLQFNFEDPAIRRSFC